MHEKKTLDEIKSELRALGVPIEGWEEKDERTVKSPLLERQAELLRKVEELIELQISKDLETLGELHETVARLKHGGGA